MKYVSLTILFHVLVIILKIFKFTFSDIVRNTVLSNVSPRVIQLPLHLPKLTANG